MTKGRRLIEAIKIRPYTYGEMQRLERIIKTKGADGLIRWKVKTVRLERT